MAVNRLHADASPVTREQVHEWVNEARRRKLNRRAFVEQRLRDLQIAPTDVVTGADTLNIIDKILDDIDSYGK